MIAAPIIGPDGDLEISVKEHLHGSEIAFFRSGVPASPFEVSGWRTTGGHASTGTSGVWGPSGDVLSRAPGSEAALVVVDLDPATLDRYRQLW